MKLLFDQNLSHRLVSDLQSLYPDSSHVRNEGMSLATDSEIWELARARGFTIVTKDADFHERGILHGFPPKTIWIRRGNCSTAMIAEILRSSHKIIETFGRDGESAVLILY